MNRSFSVSSFRGLSPRVRGNPAQRDFDVVVARSIPARAGEPRRSCRGAGCCRVYPRACGGTHGGSHAHESRQGLSPRVRGNPCCRCSPTAITWSIPARAGEPLPTAAARSCSGVYPRACGGTSFKLDFDDLDMGLSPRVRGNLAGPHRGQHADRSIPARAGEPPPGVRPDATIPVYPRACGGTISS